MTFYNFDPKTRFSPRKTNWRSRPSFVYSSSSYYRNCRRITAILVVAAIYLFLKHLPGTPKTENKVNSGRPTPYHDVDSRPHFLYHSAFREDPDIEYESRLEEALHRLEHREDDGLGEQSNHIWQVMLRKSSRIINRSEDSKLFQERNSEWSHTVSVGFPTILRLMRNAVRETT